MTSDEKQPGVFGKSYRDFLAHSPSSYHAAANVAARLETAGYARQEEDEAWDASPGGHVVVRGGAVVAYYIPEGAGVHSEFRVVGAHTDSPAFKVKPLADSYSYGFSRVNVEIYGGMLANSWLNRDLGLAGRVVTINGEESLFATGPMMFIPQLAPHLDRSVNDKLELNRQRHLQPIWAVGEHSVMEVIAEAAGVDAQTIAAMDAYSYDTHEALLLREFVAGGRQDNLSSVYPALEALLASSADVSSDGNADNSIRVLAAFDHEEVGSSTTSGAAGPFLEQVLRRTAMALGAQEEQFYQMLARSSCISSDAGHSINPGYPDHHDPTQYPILGAGPMAKINANQRYASDARGVALWLRACHEAGQASQEFVSNNSISCGSTIGPITATRLGIDTVDVGVPLLSMHSVREVSALHDVYALSEILRGYWNLA